MMFHHITGQSAANGLPGVPSFSFAPASTTALSSATDPKSASASGSITFGTVSTAALHQPTNSASFTFSHPIGNPPTSDTQKSLFQLGTTFSATNTNADSSSNTSSAFRNPTQVKIHSLKLYSVLLNFSLLLSI